MIDFYFEIMAFLQIGLFGFSSAFCAAIGNYLFFFLPLVVVEATFYDFIHNRLCDEIYEEIDRFDKS